MTGWWNPVGWLVGAFVAVVVIYTCVQIGIVAGKAVAQIAKSKRSKVPNKLKNGNKVKTPNSNPSEFQKNKGGTYTYKKTGWIFSNIIKEIVMTLNDKIWTGSSICERCTVFEMWRNKKKL